MAHRQASTWRFTKNGGGVDCRHGSGREHGRSTVGAKRCRAAVGVAGCEAQQGLQKNKTQEDDGGADVVCAEEEGRG
jgi:hypothetical protein